MRRERRYSHETRDDLPAPSPQARNTPGLIVLATGTTTSAANSGNINCANQQNAAKRSSAHNRGGGDKKPHESAAAGPSIISTNDYYYTPPIWYDAIGCKPQTAKLIASLRCADRNLQALIPNCLFVQVCGTGCCFLLIKNNFFTLLHLKRWDEFTRCRTDIHEVLEQFLTHDMKFCREENVDQHVWKCLYYNVIELVKRQLAATTTTTTEDTAAPTERMAALRERCLAHIDDGIVRFEQSLRSLEETYKFQLDAYLDNNAGSSMKGLKFVALALVSAQKIFLILGDLSRYREQLNGTKNFGRAKQWYTKAQQIIPSNGMPYNQLAIISLYTVIFRANSTSVTSLFIFNSICRRENSMPSTFTCAV